MPTSPVPSCTGSPTCPHQQGHCPDHPIKAWRNRLPPPARVRGTKLQRIRERIHAEEPWCRHCHRVLTMREMVIDHIVNLAAGGLDVPENRQPLCKDCHEEKTKAEAKQGMTR